ncbi:hypothetical protein I6E29_07515 [Arcanobacterium haemolyticum]|nr:hypothetical protein [Arcanobacterium haemolyticum]
MNSQAEGQSLIDILDEITDIVTKARSVPMSASAMVNRSEVLDLLDAAKDMVPDQIVRADGLLAQASSVTNDAKDRAQEIVAQAELDAHNTIQEAREQASRLVSQDSITIAARAQAQKIIDEAKSKADKLKRGADNYTDRALLDMQDRVVDMGQSLDELAANVQSHIDAILDQVAAGRGVIADRQDTDHHEETHDSENNEESEGTWI